MVTIIIYKTGYYKILRIMEFLKIHSSAQLILGGDWNTINYPFLLFSSQV